MRTRFIQGFRLKLKLMDNALPTKKYSALQFRIYRSE